VSFPSGQSVSVEVQFSLHGASPGAFAEHPPPDATDRQSASDTDQAQQALNASPIDTMRKPIQRIMNKWSKLAIRRHLPGVVEEVAEYAKKSNTTGTQWITLWMAVRIILKQKPQWILESGTGSSTLVLAAAVAWLRDKNPGYEGRIVSMESVPEWHQIATRNLPEKYKDTVEIVLGPREKYEVAMFRGYIHSNIPQHDYTFVLLDGPAFQDDHGVAFCADVFKAMELSSAPVVYGVSDGRASSVMVIQQLFGVKAARYWHGLYAAHFALPKTDLKDSKLNTPKDFKASLSGGLEFVKFRR
jgi:hypothetical protein